MTPDDKAARLLASNERAKRQMREFSENPKIAAGPVGTVVLDMIERGEDTSTPAIIKALEDIASGKGDRAGISEVLATGALKVISALRAPAN